MKKWILLSLIQLAVLNAFGYDFVKDKLHYKNDTLLINQIPLPPHIDELIKTKATNIKECAQMKCTYGYRIWGLRNDSLFLKNMLSCCGKELLDEEQNNLLCAINNRNEPFAEWINHNLYNQHGQLIKNISGRSIYEFDREFIIENGVLQTIKNYDNRNSKESKYRKHPELLYKYLLETIDWGILENCKETKYKSIILSFKVDESGKAIGINVLISVDKACDAEAVRVVRNIPEWDRYYKKGELLDIKWNLPILLDKTKYEEKLKAKE